MKATIATFQAIRALPAGAREPSAIAAVASFRTGETYAATAKTTINHRGEIMKILTRNFWQQAGAIAIRKFAPDALIRGDTFETSSTKKEILARALPELLNKNGKPWAPSVRPFLKQYNQIEKLDKFLQDKKPGSKVCSFCNSRVSTLEKLSLLADPLAVKAENFQSFFSHGSGSGEICLDCLFLGIMSGLALFYTSYREGQEYVITYLFPQGKDLEETDKIYRWMKDISEAGGWSNMKVRAKFFPVKPFESLILVLHTLFEKTRFIPRAIYRTMQVSNNGNTNTFLSFNSFESVDELMELLKTGESLGGDFSAFMDSFVVIKQPLVDTSRREEMARMILTFKPIEERLQFMIFELERSIRYLYEMIVATNTVKGVNGLDQETIDLCKKAGEIVGNAVFEADSFGDLYSLRNSRSLEDLLLTLSDLEFKYAKEDWKITVPEEFIRILSEDSWKKPKALLVIFAVNKYLARKYASSKNGGEKVAG